MRLALGARVKRAVRELSVRDRQAVLVIACSALALRLAVSHWSEGSPDIEFWRRFARLVASQGLVKTYALEQSFNHPPLMGYWGAGSLALAEALGVRFALVFKLPMILASAASIVLLWRAGVSRAALVLFALNPVDVLICGFHGNTDSLCAALSLLSALLLERGRPGLSGLALAAALNVKLIPAVIVLPLLLSIRGKGMFRFMLGVASAVLPAVPVLVQDAAGLYRNVIGYNSSIAGWGIHLPFILGQRQLPGFAASLYLLFLAKGKYLLLAATAVLGLLNRRRRAWNTFELGALAFSIFLVIAPGFGAQYLVYPLYFLFASRLRVAVEYSLLASAFLVLLYSLSWDGRFLVASARHTMVRAFPHLTGFLAWYVLLRYVVAELYGVVEKQACFTRSRRENGPGV